MDGKTCAIYIDGDNFMYKGIPELFNYIKKWNMKIILKTVYGDFSEATMLNWRDVCLDYNLTSIHLWKKHSKNSVDMKMSCDIQELLYTRNYNIDVFILCTGDRDFVPIIDKIHTQEKMVIGVSTNYFGTSSMFKNECDQFYYLCTNQNSNHVHVRVKEDKIKEQFDKYEFKLENDSEYIQKLKNIIKNGKYVSVLKDMVKTPEDEHIVTNIVNNMTENPSIIHKVKSVSKDVKEYVKMINPIVNKNMNQNTNSNSFKNNKRVFKKRVNKVKEAKKDFYKKNINVNKNKIHIYENKPKVNKNSPLFESETIDDLLNNINFEEVKFKEEEKEKDYSMESIKNHIIVFLKKENRSIFVSQIKDEVLKVYPKFSEKDYNFSGFSSFIKALAPEIKTESKGVGMLYAYV